MTTCELTENDVIRAVCNFLKQSGYQIDQQLNTTQRGDDIIATKTSGTKMTLCIEAKGATSARKNSNRYGRPFDSAQIKVHVAEAVFKSIQVLNRNSQNLYIQAGIAFPDETLHHKYLDLVRPKLDSMGVVVFWVKDEKTVKVEGFRSK